ncbi:MAG: hypothetical protein WC645_04310, partial [Candidatus Margulisiibacteriota bacterium]
MTPDGNGVFNVTLGTRYSLDNISVVDDNYYLEIQLEASPGVWQTLDRRQRLVSVPFAITAKNVRGGTVVTASNYENGKVISGINTTTTYGTGIFGETSCNAAQSLLAGHAGVAGNNRSDGVGVRGYSTNGIGVLGSGAVGGIYGFGTGTGASGAYGAYGYSAGTATSADPSLGAGVVGKNTQDTVPSGRIAAPGVYGESSSGAGVYGISAGAAGTAGVRGVSSGTNGWGVYGA